MPAQLRTASDTAVIDSRAISAKKNMLAGGMRTRIGGSAGGSFSPIRYETNRAKKFAKAAQRRCRWSRLIFVLLILTVVVTVAVREVFTAFSLRLAGNSSSQGGRSSSGSRLPVYWIDDSSSSHAIEAALGRHAHLDSHRVPKVSLNEAISAVETGAFRALRASVVSTRPLLSYVGGVDSIKLRTYNDVSAAMTQLNAIYSAFVGLQGKSKRRVQAAGASDGSEDDNGHDDVDVVLIIDGKISLSPDFAQFAQHQWKACLASAPADWKLLQLYTNAAPGSVLFDHRNHLSEEWISWQGDHIGTSAYFINLGGMRDIIRRTRRRVKNNDMYVWAVPAWEGPTWPDDILYYTSTTYTATHSWFQGDDGNIDVGGVMVSTRTVLQPFKRLAPELLTHHPCSSSNMKPRPESVLVLQTSFIRREDDLTSQVRKIRADVREMCKWHDRVEWKVTIAFRYQSHYEAAKRSASSTLPEIRNVVWHIVWVPGRFNKFRFVRPSISLFSLFDVILIKDSDQRIAGFPWNTFMEARKRHGRTMIAGPLREAPLESRYHKKRKRQWFKINDASYWKLGPKPFQERYRYIDPWSVTYVEQYFAAFDGAFAAWFFSQVLKDKFMLGSDGSRFVSSWGPDFMWCGAAANYISSILEPRGDVGQWGNDIIEPCLLVPVSSLHEDSRQIERNFTHTHAQQMAVDMKPVLLYAKVFPGWLTYSRDFRSSVGGVGL